jgi:SAM-dependent methyltransferase
MLATVEVPATFLREVHEVARRELARHDAEGPELAKRLARLSELYTRDRGSLEAIVGDADLLAPRLRFQLPRDVLKVAGPLRELAVVDALPRGARWRVLDVGAGLGASSLGVALFVKQRGLAVGLDVEAVDRDALALRVLGRLAARAEPAGLCDVRLRTHHADVRDPRELPTGPFDLVTVGLVLNEAFAEADAVSDAARWVIGACKRLAPGGSLVIVEPALRPTARFLHRVRDLLSADPAPPHVFAPCIRTGPCPMLERDRDWCHEDLDVALPPPLADLARAAGLRRSRLSYSYLTLRNDGRRLSEGSSDASTLRVVSQRLPSKGKLELFGCGEVGRPRLVRLNRHASAANRGFERARRGDIIHLHGGTAATDRIRIEAETIVEIGIRPAK